MREEDLTVRIYLYPYQNKSEISELAKDDARAVKDIERLEEVITRLKEYRKELYEHTQKLHAMKSYLQLQLKRTKSYYDKKVYYYVTITRLYPDNADMKQTVLYETYSGTERRAALSRFEALKKEYPGIEAIKDIEKGRWEK